MVVMRSLLHHPRLIFLDEPSKSLDPVTAEKVRTFLLDYAQAHEMTVLLTTHNMDEAEEVCDRLAFINQGRLQFAGTPQQFRHSVTVQEAVEVSVASRMASLSGCGSCLASTARPGTARYGCIVMMVSRC